MIAPVIPRNWQAFAHRRFGVLLLFAMVHSDRHCFHVRHRQPSHDLRTGRTTPSPSLRSGPSQAGPSLYPRGAIADCAGLAKICFESVEIAVESAAITTNQRGSIQCASRLSFSSFSPPRWPAACRIPPHAGLRVPLRVPSSPMPPKVTSLRAPSSAVLPVPHPAGSNSACRPAAPATDLTAFGRAKPTARTIRANRPGGPLLFARLQGESRCSRRS